MTKTDPNAVERAMRERRTVKVFREASDSGPEPAALPAGFRAGLAASIEAAAWAPFHRAAHASHRRDEAGLDSIVPWRFYVLEQESCRSLVQAIAQGSKQYESDIWRSAPRSKIPAMLRAAGALVLVTWLPDPPPEPDGHSETADSKSVDAAKAASDDQNTMSERLAEHRQRNEEHLAAAAAATQNLLVAATARQMANYWSSGGVLRTVEARAMAGIPADQPLLGAIFLFPEPAESDTFVTGKLRDLRGPIESWCRHVDVQDLSSD